MSSGREDRPASGPGEPAAVFLASEEEAGGGGQEAATLAALCTRVERRARWGRRLAQDSTYLSLTRGARRKELE